MLSLENKIALVTGASRGIGKATAIMLAGLGADIFVHYKQSLDDAKKTVVEIERLGRRAYLVSGDISSHEQILSMFESISKKTSKIDILVNNAGMLKANYIRSTGENDWNNTIDTNLKGAFFCSKYCIKYMMSAKNGSIINISSVAALRPVAAQGDYICAKAGLIALTKSMAVELGRFKIRVNAVAPGPIQTSMNSIDEQEETRLNKLIPLGRIGQGEDVAKAVAYLCSPLADYITGQVILVDGGFSIPR